MQKQTKNREITESSFVEFGPMVHILVAHCNSKHVPNRLTAVQWVNAFIKLGVSESRVESFRGKGGRLVIYGKATGLELKRDLYE